MIRSNALSLPYWAALCFMGMTIGCAVDSGGGGGECALDGEPATFPDVTVEPGVCGSTLVPYLTAPFQRVFVPPGTRYLNDHTLVQGPDGTWHVYGCTDTSLGMPWNERSILHATAPAIHGPWTPQADVLTAQGDEQVLWAPYVFQPVANQWEMVVWGGTTETTEPTLQGIRRMDSLDLDHWSRNTQRLPGGRDPYILHLQGRWLLYSVGVDADAHGQILVSESADLASWSLPHPVLTDPVPNFPWGNLESPFVVNYAGAYFLFLTRTGSEVGTYTRTLAFRSESSTHFAWAPVATFDAHAPEIVDDGGQLYMTSGGWTSGIGEARRGLSIAEIGWRPGA